MINFDKNNEIIKKILKFSLETMVFNVLKVIENLKFFNRFF